MHLKNDHKQKESRSGRIGDGMDQVDHSITKEAKAKEDKISKCGQCPKKSTLKKYHKLRIDGMNEIIRRRVCGECGYVASEKNSLKDGEGLDENRENKHFQCQKCPYSTVIQASLKRHIDGLHENNRNHILYVEGVDMPPQERVN